jgi:putative two-component system hydrogenase maturation factor HypX/HoxX
MILCSSFNGLSQRVWADLREARHAVTVQPATDPAAVVAAVRALDPELIVCPYLRERVPAEVWAQRRTIIIHPGPVGDRGPSSLDWAITEAAPTWGVTALQAVEELDAGPVWATHTFPVPADPPRKSSLYHGPVADAAAALVREVVARAGDASFAGLPEAATAAAPGRPRPAMRQADRAFDWSDPSAAVVRRIRAADGSPGVRAELCGQPVAVYDAHPGPSGEAGEPGSIVGRRHGAVLVRTGDGTVWIGQVRVVGAGPSVKLPATVALSGTLAGVPRMARIGVQAPGHEGFREIRYRRAGPVGVLSYDFYNGAMSTADCRRLLTALRRAAARDTRVLVIDGGETFSNGIHLGVIETAADPAAEAWRNINAIDDVCREIITCTRQLVVAAVAGNAGAGGVMLALGADRVLLRDGVVLNPHYRTMGLYGSEYWTYTLPRRVGDADARRLTWECLPVGAREAARIGLADAVLPGSSEGFAGTVLEQASALADQADYPQLLQAKRERRAEDEARRPLDTYRVRELAQMSRDLFDDRHGFAAARRAFLTKRPAASAAPTSSGTLPRRVRVLGSRSEVGA